MSAFAAIGIICKARIPGRTKTRSAAIVGPEAAVQLSACFLQGTEPLGWLSEELGGRSGQFRGGATANARRVFLNLTATATQ